MCVCLYMWKCPQGQPAVLLVRHYSLFLRQGFFLGLGLPVELGWPASKPRGCCSCTVRWRWSLCLASVCGSGGETHVLMSARRELYHLNCFPSRQAQFKRRVYGLWEAVLPGSQSTYRFYGSRFLGTSVVPNHVTGANVGKAVAFIRL